MKNMTPKINSSLLIIKEGYCVNCYHSTLFFPVSKIWTILIQDSIGSDSIIVRDTIILCNTKEIMMLLNRVNCNILLDIKDVRI